MHVYMNFEMVIPADSSPCKKEVHTRADKAIATDKRKIKVPNLINK